MRIARALGLPVIVPSLGGWKLARAVAIAAVGVAASSSGSGTVAASLALAAASQQHCSNQQPRLLSSSSRLRSSVVAVRKWHRGSGADGGAGLGGDQQQVVSC